MEKGKFMWAAMFRTEPIAQWMALVTVGLLLCAVGLLLNSVANQMQSQALKAISNQIEELEQGGRGRADWND